MKKERRDQREHSGQGLAEDSELLQQRQYSVLHCTEHPIHFAQYSIGSGEELRRATGTVYLRSTVRSTEYGADEGPPTASGGMVEVQAKQAEDVRKCRC